jgi:hypothetical protein
MSRLPKSLEERENPEEVGADHGEVTGAWRVVRNGVVLAAVALGVLYLFYA